MAQLKSQMSQEEKERIKKNWPYLLENINGQDLMDKFVQEGIFEIDDTTEIRHEVTATNKTRLFLEKLYISRSGSCSPYEVFTKVLDESGYGFVVKKLNNTQVQVSEKDTSLFSDDGVEKAVRQIMFDEPKGTGWQSETDKENPPKPNKIKHITGKCTKDQGLHECVNHSCPTPTNTRETLQKSPEPDIPKEPFIVRLWTNSIKICAGCGQKFQKPVKAPNDYVISHKEHRAVFQNSERKIFFDKRHYHISANCLIAKNPDFVPSSILVPPEILKSFSSEHFEYYSKYGVELEGYVNRKVKL